MKCQIPLMLPKYVRWFKDPLNDQHEQSGPDRERTQVW